MLIQKQFPRPNISRKANATWKKRELSDISRVSNATLLSERKKTTSIEQTYSRYTKHIVDIPIDWKENYV